MRKRSPQTRFAPLAFSAGLAIALVSSHCEARPEIRDPAITIGKDGCSFSPEVLRLWRALPRYQDMQEHTEKRSARFAFERLHGVGLVEKQDAEWSEVRLYFREDLPALRATLARLGFRVRTNDRVEVSAAAEDQMALAIWASPSDGRYFADARSYLACGSV